MLNYLAKWHLANKKIEENKRNGSKTTQKSSREDNEQLKYDLTVIVSSKLFFNLGEWVTRFAKYQLDKYLTNVLTKNSVCTVCTVFTVGKWINYSTKTLNGSLLDSTVN